MDWGSFLLGIPVGIILVFIAIIVVTTLGAVSCPYNTTDRWGQWE